MPYIITSQEYAETPIAELPRRIRIHIKGQVAKKGLRKE